MGRPPLRLGRPKERPQAPFQPSHENRYPFTNWSTFAPPKWSKFTPPLTDLVRGWNPFRKGEFFLSDEPGLGLDIDEKVIANHPYQPSPFASLWHKDWLGDFTQRSS